MAAALPDWIRPQLTQLVQAAPDGDQWLHEIKYDGFRMHARLDRGAVRLLTRNGLNWTAKYPQIARAVAALDARQAYLDGEDLSTRPLIERKERLAGLRAQAGSPLQYSDHQTGQGPAFYEKACPLGVEGIVSKRADAPYAPGNRGHCTSFSIPIAICRRHIPVAPASRPTRSRLRSPATCRPSDPVHRGAARSFPRNSSMDVRCCGVRNDIVGAAQDCSRGPD